MIDCQTIKTDRLHNVVTEMNNNNNNNTGLVYMFGE